MRKHVKPQANPNLQSQDFFQNMESAFPGLNENAFSASGQGCFRTQKRCADERINQVCDQCSKADV